MSVNPLDDFFNMAGFPEKSKEKFLVSQLEINHVVFLFDIRGKTRSLRFCVLGRCQHLAPCQGDVIGRLERSIRDLVGPDGHGVLANSCAIVCLEGTQAVFPYPVGAAYPNPHIVFHRGENDRSVRERFAIQETVPDTGASSLSSAEQPGVVTTTMAMSYNHFLDIVVPA